MNLTRTQGRVIFKVFPFKFMKREKLFQVQVTCYFFNFVKQDPDQYVGYDDFMQFAFAWNFLKVSPFVITSKIKHSVTSYRTAIIACLLLLSFCSTTSTACFA